MRKFWSEENTGTALLQNVGTAALGCPVERSSTSAYGNANRELPEVAGPTPDARRPRSNP